MKKPGFTGKVIQRDGTTTYIHLREIKSFWVDNDKNWWRKSTGVKTGLPDGMTYPRLVLSTVKPIGVKVRTDVKYTHTGKVKRHTGMPSKRRLRETKTLWIDESGMRFYKCSGWSNKQEADGTYQRLILSTLSAI